MMNHQVIDLSHNNTVTSLESAKQSGVVGVIHKLTEGLGFTDNTARERCGLAKDAGLLWGLYHFLRPGMVGRQAAIFLDRADKLGVNDADTLLACDFEVDHIALADVLKFLQFVEAATGRRPVLYSGHTLKELGGCSKLPELKRYRLWLSQYGPRAVLPAGFEHYWLWQWSETGTIEGISGHVDLNSFDGDAEQLTSEWAGA
jgi:lysozyme